MTQSRARLEAWLDFPDEELEPDGRSDAAAEIDELLAALDRLALRAESGRALRDGLSVAIAGPANAGKSSLLNRLAGYDAAIVTPIPGTTRDPLREQVSIGGVPLTVVDTAGLRESTDPVEQEGLRRALTEVGRADRVLWVADVRDPVASTLAAAREAAGAQPITLVRNKIDLLALPPSADRTDDVDVLLVSALTGAGLDLLSAHLRRLAGWTGEVAGTFSARRRHLDALARAGDASPSPVPSFGRMEVAAEQLRAAQAALSELTGELTSDDLLGEIFATFCIGK